MLLFIIGLVLFLGIHSIAIVAPDWRTRQIQQRGLKAWKGLYSVASLVGFVLLVVGYGMARRDAIVLYTPPQALRHLALLVMLPVFPLLVAAYRPGRIKRAVKHPMLLAVKLWATAHLLANGTLPDVLLFGAFIVWAGADRVSVKRRSAAQMHEVPAAAGPPRAMNDVIAIVVGLAIYAVFLAGAHRWLIGVSPLG